MLVKALTYKSIKHDMSVHPLICLYVMQEFFYPKVIVNKHCDWFYSLKEGMAHRSAGYPLKR